MLATNTRLLFACTRFFPSCMVYVVCSLVPASKNEVMHNEESFKLKGERCFDQVLLPEPINRYILSTVTTNNRSGKRYRYLHKM
jgi:hypothetical protein